MIYLYANLRDAPKGVSLYRRLAERIRVEKDACGDMDVIFDAFPDLMI
jgi:hypothetical protein